MKRQKSRAIVENVLSAMKAGFKSILNLVFNQKKERKKMDHQKSKSTFSAILLSLILMVAALGVSSAVAADKKMVKDPSTGKMVSVPEYGGTLTHAYSWSPPDFDSFNGHGDGRRAGFTGVIEKLGWADWAIDRDVYGWGTELVPEFAIVGNLAESWETPDPRTYIFHIRQGVHWHNKPPVSGRELTAKDVEYNYHRYLGLGSGFTEASAYHAAPLGAIGIESVTATDKFTVVFKLAKLNLVALNAILLQPSAHINAPEVIEEYGGINDEPRNLIGTGPFILTDFVTGSSVTKIRNPDYWGYDEKYPDNRLPYVDEVTMLVIPDEASRIAALRTGKIDFVGVLTHNSIVSTDTGLRLQQTNPELEVSTFTSPTYNKSGSMFNTSKPPFDDIRVRHAMQMALDLERIKATYWKGMAETTPQGFLGSGLVEFGYVTPFEEWPEEVQQYYRYDPAGAEKLLDEAGYPRGADGIRFKTTLDVRDAYDTFFYEIAVEHFREIGVEVEMTVYDTATWFGRGRAGDHEMTSMSTGYVLHPAKMLPNFTTGNTFNLPHVQDPAYDAMVEALIAAATLEEQQRLAKEAHMHLVEQHWSMWGGAAFEFNFIQPWVRGYNGEASAGADRGPILARLWIDQDLKKEMGH